MKRRIIIILVLLFSIFLTACTKVTDKSSEGRTVKIYYIDTKTSGLAVESYQLITTKVNDQINELLYMLIKKAPKNKVNKNVTPDDTLPKFDFDIKNKSLTLNFGATYHQLTGVSEVLCRAAIVKTLSQLADVEYVQFNVDGQPLQDSENNIVGPLTADDFVDNTEEARTSYKAKLYFANKKGDKLIEYVANIKYTGTESIEELVILQLIKGPAKAGMYATVPKGTQLLNISKSDGICTIDFNEQFTEKLPNISEKVAIYSIVNTLVELPDINKVQFTINSKPVKKYNEDLKFNIAFDANLDLIQNPE